MPQKVLKMTFDPNTIEHLGVRMYSTLPPVLAELIGNAYDADAKHALLTLNDSGGEKEIVIEDNGIGMTFNEINEKFLRIGRNRREEEKLEVTPGGRKIIGKKGLGKLSFFGIAHEIEIATKKDGKRNIFVMKWEDIKASTGDYKPVIVAEDETCSADDHGTKITLKNIQRETGFSSEDLAKSLSKMFIIDSNFEISIKHNSANPITVSNEMRYADIEKEIEWEIPVDTDIQYSSDYRNANKITGHIIATKKPIAPKTNMRGIILLSRKKMVNAPEYFSDSTSSHFFSYLTGWLEVDFIDDLEDDVIATNRQSLNWGHEEIQKLRIHLGGLINSLERDWRKKRSESREKELSESAGIDISNWFNRMPEDIRKKIKPIVETVIKDSELSAEAHQSVVKQIHEIVPEYPRYHWRHLHPEIKTASETDYQSGDYYRAFQEAAKRYVTAVKEESKSENKNDASMMGEVFGEETGSALQVAQNFKKPGGTNFQAATINNIEEGQKFLSMGVISGCRNPVSHEEISDLRESGLFTENDCLDALSLLSHLFSRLDRRRGSNKK